MMRRGAGAGQVPSAALRPKGASGEPCPAAGRRRPALPGRWVSVPSIPPPPTGRRPALLAPPRTAADSQERQPRAGQALSPPPSARRVRAQRNAAAERGPPPRPGCGGRERSPGPAPAHKGEARNRARTGRRTRRVGGLVPPRGGSGGGAAVTAGRGRGLCPGILKKPPVFFPRFPQREPGSPVQAVGKDGGGSPRGAGRSALAALGLHPRSRGAKPGAAQSRLRLSPAPPPPGALLAFPPRPRPSQQAWAVSARSRRNFTAKFCSWTSPS